MTLRRKTFIIIGVTLVGVLTILYLASHTVLLQRFTRLEEEVTQKNVELAISTITNDLSTLSSVAGNIAGQTETANYIINRSSDYAINHFQSSTFTENRLNLVMIANSSGEIVFKKYFDLNELQESPLPRAVQDQLSTNTLLLHHPDSGSTIKGVVNLSTGPMLVASRSIINRSNGAYLGTTIVGRYLDKNELERLSKRIYLNLAVEPFNSSKIAPHFLEKDTEPTEDNPFIAVPLNKNDTAGYTVLNDIYGTPAYILKVEIPRMLFLYGLSSITFFLVLTLIGWLVFGLIFILLIDKNLFIRLTQIGKTVNKAKTNLAIRIPPSGDDEIARLSTEINDMLTEFQRFHTELHQNEERYRNLYNELAIAQRELQDIIDFLPDPTFVVDKDRKITAWNRAMEEITQVKKEDIIGKGDGIYAVPFYGEPIPTLIDHIFTNPSEITYKADHLEKVGSTLIAETHVPALFDGKGAYLWIKASPLYDHQGNIVGAIESIRDISTRLHAEKELRFFKQHDSVTGLYNRGYFEQELARQADEKIAPVSIIVIGLDGLKLIDDTLGHEAGDTILRATAEIFKAVLVGHNSLIARVGGDEFAALLPGCDRKAVEAIYKKISESIETYNAAHQELPLSMSVGFAASNDPKANLHGLLKEADNNMYHQKLHYTQDTQSATVQILMRALEAKDFAKEGHVDRLQNIVASVGAALGMSERRIEGVRRLACFHDIGKVGIPDRILQKQGPLSPAEITEMQRHCEMGFRIAQSAPILVPIADWILKHHEWWNGKGYPLGLQGKEIPLECRLLAIADAWDALTSDRPYRKAMPYEKASAELMKRSGTQFDPELVETFLQVLDKENAQSEENK